jgi:hypothetical protein
MSPFFDAMMEFACFAWQQEARSKQAAFATRRRSREVRVVFPTAVTTTQDPDTNRLDAVDRRFSSSCVTNIVVDCYRIYRIIVSSTEIFTASSEISKFLQICQENRVPDSSKQPIRISLCGIEMSS